MLMAQEPLAMSRCIGEQVWSSMTIKVLWRRAGSDLSTGT